MSVPHRPTARPDRSRPAAVSFHRRRRAVVLGGSIGGLLAAAALAPHVDEVLVLERDRLTDRPGGRPGTPQAGQAHGLLASGRIAIESLLPGITDELVAAGAVARGDIGDAGAWYIGGVRVADCSVGAGGLALSRTLLESAVRRRVAALPTVGLRDGAEVRGLVLDDGVVRGVRVQDLRGGEEEVAAADLVVDATGRPGRGRRWLEEHGYLEPAEERVQVGVRYACTHVEHRDGDAGGRSAVVSAATPERPRGGVAIRQEDGRWVVLVYGYTEDQPPLDADGFRQFAGTVVAPELVELLADRPLLEPPAPYRFPHCARRRFEGARTPRGFVAVGDALCSIDPTFGQGMSLAALEAVALAELVADAPDPAGVGPVFHRRAAEIVDRAWLVVVGADVQLPGVVGDAPPGHALTAGWVRRVQRAAGRDPEVARRLLRVTNLLDPPTSLMRPAVAARVLRQGVTARPGLRRRASLAAPPVV